MSVEFKEVRKHNLDEEFTMIRGGDLFMSVQV